MNILQVAHKNIENFRKGTAIIKTKPNSEIRIRQIRHSFLFGCAIKPLFTQPDKLYLKKFRELFNYATLENILKWAYFEPAEKQKRWKESDKIISWCLKNNIDVKGHALAWGHRSGMPVWLKSKSNEEIEKLQINRIKEIMQRYKGKIRYYEIVNEPTRALLLDSIIKDFAEKCMITAAKADLTARLIFNGNKLFIKDRGKEEFRSFLKRMISKKVTFSGVGIQAHQPLDRRIPNKEMWEMIEYLASIGKEVHITEFMVQDMEPIKQAKYYKEIYTICFGNPNVRAITTWGLSDDRNHISGSGLLDNNLKEKPAYKALKKLIHKDWSTSIKGLADEKGVFEFKGFYGNYEATIGRQRFKFSLKRNRQTINL